MNRELLKAQQQWIREELERCADFWVKNGWESAMRTANAPKK